MFPGAPSGKNYYKADIVLAKIAKRLKITEDEFLCKRFFPFLSKARLKRRDTNEEKADSFPNWTANGKRFQAKRVKGTSDEYDIYQLD